MDHLRPEYPALKKIKIEEKASKRLASSRKGFFDKRRLDIVGLHELLASDPWLSDIIGQVGSFDHSNASLVDSWLRHWRMPSGAKPPLDLNSSLAVFVGIDESNDMPSANSLRSKPYVSVTTKYVRVCARITETVPFFMSARHQSGRRFNNARSLLFEYLSSNPEPGPKLIAQMKSGRDEIFYRRTNAAAVRWAVAHEMAHVVTSKKDREKAYTRVATLYPNMEEEQWEPKRQELENYRESVELYRDEIACDLLAMDFVLASPFSANDLMTQVSGSLVALEALKWDGWFFDKSKVSPTHPSPALRFKIVMRAWLEKLTDPETWQGRDLPGPMGVEDIAMWFAFNRWSSGEYSEGRAGVVINEDICKWRKELLSGIAELGVDPMYILFEDSLFRVPEGNGALSLLLSQLHETRA